MLFARTIGELPRGRVVGNPWAKLENGDKVVAKRPVEQVEEPISRTRGKEKGQQANESERPSQKQHHRSRETADEDENGQSKAEGERRE